MMLKSNAEELALIAQEIGAEVSVQYARRRRGEYPAATGHTSQMQSDQK